MSSEVPEFDMDWVEFEARVRPVRPLIISSCAAARLAPSRHR